jgi:xanthine dehydrogenase/oxidase
VEVDVLTGEVTVLRSDLIYDAGDSLNPALDIGQVRGGFVQGLGNVLCEYVYYEDSGRPYTDGTWQYKIPDSKTIPIDFRVSLLTYSDRKSPHDDLPVDPYGIQSSKSTGEPPLVLANSAFFAVKHAVRALRSDLGFTDWFSLDSPATPDRIHMACLYFSISGAAWAPPGANST